ncbi:hypothetical protein Plhal703r1_c07g0039741 [Plasmopara halstedii]
MVIAMNSIFHRAQTTSLIFLFKPWHFILSLVVLSLILFLLIKRRLSCVSHVGSSRPVHFTKYRFLPLRIFL